MKRIKGSEIKAWEKVPNSKETLIKDGVKTFGVKAWKELFINPITEEAETYTFFGGRNWVTIVPITNEGNLVLTRQYKQGVNEIGYEFPAGTAEFGEKSQDVAIREFAEETGYSAERIVPIPGNWYISTRKSDNFQNIFVALNCENVGSQKLDANEEIEIWEYSPQEVVTLLKDNEVKNQDGLAFLLAMVHGYIRDRSFNFNTDHHAPIV